MAVGRQRVVAKSSTINREGDMKMLKRTCCIVALCALPVLALADSADVTGQVDIGLRGVDTKSYSAKFDEYRDMDDGAFGGASLRAFRGGYYLDLTVNNPGMDDQSYLLKGGRFGEFKYSLFYDKMIHRLTDNARTYFNGVGSDNLIDSGNSANPALWGKFDYDIERKVYGAEGEVSIWDPIIISLGVSQEEKDGVVPIGGSGAYELPAPVDWEDKKGFFSGTYNEETISLTIRGDVSEFDNSDDVVSWLGNKTSLAPDSDFWKLAGRLVWKAPVWDSTLAIRSSYAELSNDLSLIKSDPGNSITDKFDGDITYTSFDAAYDFVPCENFEGKFFMSYYDRDNDSSELDIDGRQNTPFEYERTVFGFEGSYKIPAKNVVGFGYEYTDVDRDGRGDNTSSNDDLYFVQLRSRSFDDIELKAKYEHLERDGNMKSPSSVTDKGARSYDVADQDRDRVELAAMAYVNENIDLGIEVAWQESDFDDTDDGLHGLTDLEHEEAYLTAGYTLSELFSAMLYLGIEYDESKMTSALGPTGEYTQKMEFDTFAYGLALDVPVNDKLTITANWNYAEVDGESKFNTAALIDMSDVEDYTKEDLEVECTYQFTEALAGTLGYIYEKYRFDDDQWTGYDLNDPSVGPLTGAYAEQDYEANIGYLMVSYSF
jgi:MtrB/PioB family decaheme-associated outer membrane protein